MTRDPQGRFCRDRLTAPLCVRKAVTPRGKAVAKGNVTRASKRRRKALAMFGVVLP